ncbi:hypothetical protein WS95_16565 [Burkholderia sp. MSMB1826]|nr:hypothetical protein WS95_16565 [Burkholderia sp. MSMB1826]
MSRVSHRALFGQHVVQRAPVSALDRAQIVSCSLEEANERRDAHVASGKRFHACKRRACDTGMLGQFFL